MAPKNSNSTRLAFKLTALIMAHGLASTAPAQTNGVAPGTGIGSTNLPPTRAADTNAPTQLQEVIVTGQPEAYKPDAISLPKITEPLLDTPQSITVVPRQLMDDQGTTTLREALRNVAGISLAAGEGGSQGDNLTLRGFTARNDIFLDGMRDFGSYNRDPFNWSEVEVLKGPESVMFGRGSTGGIINQESKTPELRPFVAGSLSLGTDLTRRATVDVNGPVPALGEHTAFRLNMMGNDSQVADRDVAENRRFGFAPSIAFELGPATHLTLNYLHQSEDNIPDYGLPWLFNGPAPVARNNYYGFRDDYLKTDVDIATIRLEHVFNETIQVRDQMRYANYNRNARITEPRIAGTPTPATPLSALTVNRNEIAVRSDETFFQNQFDALTRFDTGFINHTLLTGIEAGRETSDPKRFTYTGVPATSLLSPDEDQLFSGTSRLSSSVKTTANSVGLYAMDTLKLGEKWELSGGFRWDYFDAHYSQSVAPATDFNQSVTMPSWRGAVVYKPVPAGSLYFAYGTSFNPSAETLSLTAGSANVAPEENETFEVGTKWGLFSDRLSVRAAAFRTYKTNARETNPTNSLLVVVAGEQRVDGIEMEVSGRLTDRWQVFASYAYLESKVIRSTFFPAAVGSRLANVPQNTFSLWTTYALPWNLEIGGGARYVGSRTASSTVPLDPVTGLVKEVPGYYTLDAMLKYRVTKNIELQVNVYNLTDKYYFDQVHPAHIVPGAGRSALFTANFRF